MQVAEHEPADDDEPDLVDRGLLAGLRPALLPSRQVRQHQDDGAPQRQWRRQRRQQHTLVPGPGRRLHRPGAREMNKLFLPDLSWMFCF